MIPLVDWRYLESISKGAGMLLLGLLSLFAILDQWVEWLPYRFYMESGFTIMLGLGYGSAFQREWSAAGGDASRPTVP